jgi:hypothetical protein
MVFEHYINYGFFKDLTIYLVFRRTNLLDNMWLDDLNLGQYLVTASNVIVNVILFFEMTGLESK